MKNLLEKYRRGDISPEELETLGKEVDTASDYEIGNILEEVWMHESGVHDGVRRRMPDHKIRKIRLWTSVAAGILLLVAGVLSLRLADLSHEQNLLANREMRIDAGENGKSRIVLPDGTKVTLNTRSTIEYPADFGV